MDSTSLIVFNEDQNLLQESNYIFLVDYLNSKIILFQDLLIVKYSNIA